MIKQKRIIMLTIVWIVCMLCGCARSSDSKSTEGADNSTGHMPQEQSYAMAAVGDAAVQDDRISPDKTSASAGIKQLDTQFFNGEEADLWYGNDSKLIVKKQTALYLYDVKTGETVSRTDTEIGKDITIYPYHNGYCVIGSAGDPEAGNEKMLCIFYDEILHETNRISLNGMVDNVMFTVFAVSTDGSMLAYFDFWKGLNIYDVETANTKQLISVDSSYEERKNILIIDALFFEEGGKGLVFSAQTDKNNVAYESWGRINIDGSELENHILDKGLQNAIAFRNGRLIFGESSLAFCDAMGYVDVKNQTQVYSTDIPNGRGVGGPAVSQNGEYFAVTQLHDTSAQISIYRTEDFSLIHQETIEDDNEGYFYRIPKIYLFDQMKAGIICLGGHNEIPLKTVLIDFGK